LLWPELQNGVDRHHPLLVFIIFINSGERSHSFAHTISDGFKTGVCV
jgi:hypothetical protein